MRASQNTIQHVVGSVIPNVLIVDVSHSSALDYTGLHVLFAMAVESKHLRVKMAVAGVGVRDRLSQLTAMCCTTYHFVDYNDCC